MKNYLDPENMIEIFDHAFLVFANCRSFGDRLNLKHELIGMLYMMKKMCVLSFHQVQFIYDVLEDMTCEAGKSYIVFPWRCTLDYWEE